MFDVPVVFAAAQPSLFVTMHFTSAPLGYVQLGIMSMVLEVGDTCIPSIYHLKVGLLPKFEVFSIQMAAVPPGHTNEFPVNVKVGWGKGCFTVML
jgi:hypothetical protein